MMWRKTWRADPRAAAIADRHYSRKTIGSLQFTPPGRAIVLVTSLADALWVSSWPSYVTRQWFPDAWMCTIFRNESPHRSSDLIRQAVAATCAIWGVPPKSGLVTIVDPRKVRHKRDPGRCFQKADFVLCGVTQEGLLLFRLAPEDMPEPCLPDLVQLPLWETTNAKG